MAEFKHKEHGIRFVISDDITLMQLERYEQAAQKIISAAEHRSDGVLARAAISAAYDAGILEELEGLPERKKDAVELPARMMWWVAQQISQFIMGIKEIHPNSSGMLQ